MDLLLITKQFPYGNEESFIENEINYASKYFNRIYIIACEVPKSITKVRKIPDNCKVLRIGKKSESIQKISDIANSFVHKSLDEKSYQKEKSIISGIKQLVFFKYFEEKCRRIVKNIIKSRFLNDISEDFILYSYWLFTTAKVGTLIAKEKRPRLMFSRAHRYDLYEEKNSLNYLPYRDFLLSSYDLILPCSQNGSDYLISRHPQYIDKIKTSYLGTTDHGTAPNQKNEIFTIVSCSRVEKVKRVDRILDALEIVANKGVRIKWIHIGDGSQYEQLSEKAKKVNKNVICDLKGSMPNKEVMNFYFNNTIDLFINVSSSEGLPVSLMEAISFGFPVVATDVGGTSEIVCEQTGILLEENFKDINLANAIFQYMDIYNTPIYDANRIKCRKYWENHFQAEVNYTGLYQMICEEC